MPEGAYEGGVFKFKIDFPLKYPLNLPLVTFTQKQVYHPLVELQSGRLDLARLFEHPDSSYCDENYICGRLVHCYDGFAKELLSKIWNIFNNTLQVQSFVKSKAEAQFFNQEAVSLYIADRAEYLRRANICANSVEAVAMFEVNAPDSLLQAKPVHSMT